MQDLPIPPVQVNFKIEHVASNASVMTGGPVRAVDTTGDED